jgi:hypothetical protein
MPMKRNRKRRRERNRLDKLLHNIERYSLRLALVIILLVEQVVFVISVVRANASHVTNPPAAIPCIRQNPSDANSGSDEGSSVPPYNGTGDHGLSKSGSSRLHQSDKSPPRAACHNQKCCRAGKLE